MSSNQKTQPLILRQSRQLVEPEAAITPPRFCLAAETSASSALLVGSIAKW
jgi:hypothetical protein